MEKLLNEFCHQSESFKLAWQEWEHFREEQKKRLTPTSVRKQLKLLATYAEADAIAVLEQSIRNGWQVLFDLKPTAVTARPTLHVLPAPTAPRPTALAKIR